MPFLARNHHIPLVTFGAEMTFLATTVAGHLIFMLHKAHGFAAVISDTLLRHRTWAETKLGISFIRRRLFIGLLPVFIDNSGPSILDIGPSS
jgi:hypothetical protein